MAGRDQESRKLYKPLREAAGKRQARRDHLMHVRTEAKKSSCKWLPSRKARHAGMTRLHSGEGPRTDRPSHLRYDRESTRARRTRTQKARSELWMANEAMRTSCERHAKTPEEWSSKPRGGVPASQKLPKSKTLHHLSAGRAVERRKSGRGEISQGLGWVWPLARVADVRRPTSAMALGMDDVCSRACRRGASVLPCFPGR